MGCDGCVTYLSLEHPPGEGVGPVHSREVPLPLTKDEIGTLDFEDSSFEDKRVAVNLMDCRQ